jgi:hypothetical protein
MKTKRQEHGAPEGGEKAEVPETAMRACWDRKNAGQKRLARDLKYMLA